MRYIQHVSNGLTAKEKVELIMAVASGKDQQHLIQTYLDLDDNKVQQEWIYGQLGILRPASARGKAAM